VLAVDEQLVQQFAAEGADHPLADRIAPLRQLHPRRPADDPPAGGLSSSSPMWSARRWPCRSDF
jgi:hypothetical protein